MKLSLTATTAAAALVTTALVFAQDTKPAATAPPAATEFKDLKAKASYAVGQNMGKAFKTQGVDLDPDLIVKGLKDALDGKASLTEEQIKETLAAFQLQMQSKDKLEGENYLKTNGAKPGVVTRPSGLQYKVVKEGTGASPKATDSVSVHYEGRLINGTVFDSSIKRNEPATFVVNQVINGWKEALQLMTVGSKWQITIPSDLAYGANPRQGGPIPPNAVLVFDVELLAVGTAK